MTQSVLNERLAATNDLDAEGLRGTIASFVRAEFRAPADLVTSFIDLLLEDAARLQLPTYQADLLRMQTASTALSETIRELLDPSPDRETGPAGKIETFTADLRHRLRTPITTIMGYGELLLEDAREDGLPDLVESLHGLLGAARGLLGGIEAMVAFIHEDPGAFRQPSAEIPDAATLVDQATSALRSVFSRDTTIETRVTGHILVVDDNPSSVELLTLRLEREGHRISACDNGADALRLIGLEEFDLVLVDLLMPGLNGIDVLRELRSDPRTASLPVIVMSALDQIESAVRCIEMGADDFLSKPLNPTLLRARLSALLDRKFLRDREQARAEQLRLERERSEFLLRSMLPGPVVQRLRDGETTIADQYEAATILFCDLVGFTSMVAALPPSRTIALLNQVFSSLDRLTAQFGLEKIKTVGDAYMLAGGLPRFRKDHVAAVATMALQMPGAVAQASHALGMPLEVRIGMHTGPVAAGIIGNDKFAYDVWGDTVNTASRLERTGLPGRVHVSCEVRDALGPGWTCEALPRLDIKGKGLMDTFLLATKGDQEKPATGCGS